MEDPPGASHVGSPRPGCRGGVSRSPASPPPPPPPPVTTERAGASPVWDPTGRNEARGRGLGRDTRAVARGTYLSAHFRWGKAPLPVEDFKIKARAPLPQDAGLRRRTWTEQGFGFFVFYFKRKKWPQRHISTAALLSFCWSQSDSIGE